VIGVQDNGYPLGINNEEMEESLKVLFNMAKTINALVELMFVVPGHKGSIVKVKVERAKIDSIIKDIKVILMGQEGVGKSTLLGVLTSGKCDDGKGGSRTFKHIHEILRGQTTISYQLLGFDS
jgi:elongation factor 1-alpha